MRVPTAPGIGVTVLEKEIRAIALRAAEVRSS
jgi:hypothetical protein